MDALTVSARLARQKLDEQRMVLHGIDQAIDETRTRLFALRQEMEAERRATAGLADGELLLARYQRRVLEQERALHAKLDRLERERSAQVERIAEHRMEVRRLEILAEHRADRMRAAALRREQKTADELALLRRHHRR